VIGSDGLEIKDTLFGWIRISHEAGVQIHNRVVIGANCTINRGLLGNDTIIQQETMIDSGVHIAHACQIGQRNTITAHATLGGSVVTGNEVFIGLNATIVNAVTICDAAFIGAGAIVARSISEPVRVLPYPSKTLPN
jgi:UDP-3-O-[3-hydroxymyristoyl] glucosamine N-acyltransferase